MTIEIDLDLGDRSGADLEAGGGVNQPGWYRARVDRCGQDQNTGNLFFQFIVTEGPYQGSRITEYLNNPATQGSDAAQQTATNRMGGWFQRLGLWDGKKPAPRKWHPEAAIGRDVVLHLANENYIDKKGNEVNKVRVSFMGVFPPDHPKIPDDQRKKLKLPAARAVDAAPGNGSAHTVATATPAAPVQDNYGDL